jgi:AraC-like DNA-binding protein
MIIACLSPSADRLRLAEREIATSLLERAKQIIDGQLRSPTLRPATLCRQLGISRSQLYRVFEKRGGVVHYIRQQRLIRIFDTLCNRDDCRSIADIAADFYFEDASSFARAFRQEFGCSATDVRVSAAAGLPLRVCERKPSEGNDTSFSDYCKIFN